MNGKIYAIGGTDRGWGEVLAIVEEYDTGFRDDLTSINAKGKLTTTWGEIRRTK